LIDLLVALYPAHWRRRYGEEFRAVLEMRPLGPFDVGDILLGALDARLARRLADAGANTGGHRVLLRIGGVGAIVGAILWVLGLVLASGFGDQVDGTFAVSLMVIGTLGLLLALVGLSAFQGHRDPRLAWPAFGVPALGTLVSLVGIAGFARPEGEAGFIGDLTPWWVWMLGVITMLIGSVLFAVATIRAAVLSRAGAIVLGLASAAALVLGSGLFGIEVSGVEPSFLMPAILVAFAAGWVALGVSALRRGPIRTIASV
jgi:hypothetical protein